MPSNNSHRNNTAMLFQPNTNHTTNHISKWAEPPQELSAGALKRQAFKERQFQERCLSTNHSLRGADLSYARGDKGSGKADGRPRPAPKLEARLAERRLRKGEEADVRLKKKQKPDLKWDDEYADYGYSEQPRARMEVDLMDLVVPNTRIRRSKGFDPVRRPETIPGLLRSSDSEGSYGVPATPSLGPVDMGDDRDADFNEPAHSEFSYDMFSEVSMDQPPVVETGKGQWGNSWYRFLVPFAVQ
ncbi:hypothetical protein FRC03_008353 [Tulasnella sp. 419]|nr:hypothetical protein FRC02_009018 [Tulasnella sp. 418]KAG8968218.1 hypothetical protein FRC03_008353 [Tulasnella sp. 419]